MPAVRARHLALLLLPVALAAVSPACAVDVLFQAEEVNGPGAVVSPGYGFVDRADEIAGWAGVNSSPNPGFPNEPGHFVFSFAGLPPGPYRLWARLARWGGTPDTTPIPTVVFADGRRHTFRCEFPADRAHPLGAWFPMYPGGMVGAEGQWAWLPVFETGPLRGRYELTVTGEPGTGGSGNYKGLWFDAFRFENLGPDSAIKLPEDTGLPGRWESGVYLTPQAPKPGGLAVTFPSPQGRPVARRVFARPIAAGKADHLALWVCSAVRLEGLSLTVRDHQGRALAADLCHLANARPLRPGTWYRVLVPLSAQVDRQRLTSLEVTIPDARVAGQEAVVTLYNPHLVTMARARAELAAAAGTLRPEALASARLGLRVPDFPRQAVGPEKKVIMWARGGWGGTPSTGQVRDRIRELYDSGADGIVLTVTPLVDGQPVYFADCFMSPQRFRDEDFAADYERLRAIEWGPLDHSLLRLNVMPGTVDWFDEEWSAVVQKARFAARCCRVGRLAGIMFDTEQYDWERGIFRYDNRPLKAQKSLEQYAAQARLRGRQMAEAMVAEMPGIDVLTTFAGSIGYGGNELLLPFLEGMAEAPGCHVHDGCEPAYPARCLRDFLELSDRMLSLSKTIERGYGLWLNHRIGRFSRENLAANYRSPEGLAHSLHYALRLSDKYVWLYAEDDLTYWPEATPAAYYEAIKSARRPQDPRWAPPPAHE